MRRASLLLIAVVTAVLAAAPSLAADTKCQAVDTSTTEALPGVTLTWDSSFRCDPAARTGSYSIPVAITNARASAEAVDIQALRLSHTTPRPRGQRPDATAQARRLPVNIAPGERARFDVSGGYQLVSADDGDKANLHLRALGRGTQSGDLSRLGINVQLRGPGAGSAHGQAGARLEHPSGPPTWAGGPPPWAGGPGN